MLRAAGLRVHGGTVVPAGGAAPRAGELAVFCHPVVTAPAVVRRDRAVLADAWLPDLVRLGELERHLGDGVIEAIVDAELAKGRLKKRERRRIMSYPLVIRLMIAMALMPGASYCEALRTVAGLLADIPFTREWHVPAGKVITDWRLPVPAGVMEAIFWQAAGPLIAGDEPPAVLLAGMMVLAADGMLVNLADTPANRAMFGSTGTADDSSPFPQLRVVALTARAGRAMLRAIPGRSSAGEQTLLRRLARRRPDLFAGRVTCFDRNFRGYELIQAILYAGGHVIARMKEGISLDCQDSQDRGWLPDGSRLSWLNAPSGKKENRLPVRVTEHNAILPAGDGAGGSAEKDLPPGRHLAALPLLFTGAGNRTSGPLLRSGSPRLVIQEAWAWLTATQLARASAAAALRSQEAAARALRRKNGALVTADEESFTAVVRHMIRSMTSTQVTASSSLEAIAAAAEAAARAALHILNLPRRQRHSKRTQKGRPKFPHATATKTTVTGKPQVTVFAPGCPGPDRRPVSGNDFAIAWTTAARRALTRLPEKVATAVVEFPYGSLAASPHRVGKPLKLSLEGLHSARRGDYRVIYRIDDQQRLVTVIAIEHRSDIYRPRRL